MVALSPAKGASGELRPPPHMRRGGAIECAPRAHARPRVQIPVRRVAVCESPSSCLRQGTTAGGMCAGGCEFAVYHWPARRASYQGIRDRISAQALIAGHPCPGHGQEHPPGQNFDPYILRFC